MVDPAVVAVVGHWRPETTAAAAPVYADAGLPFLPAGQDPFSPADPATLPDDFLQDYAAVTPFDETAGPYAGAAYDAFQLLWLALEEAAVTKGDIDRQSVSTALDSLQYAGYTGNIYRP